MTIIESGLETINKSQQEVYAFLADCNNHQQLMPEQVVNWQSDTNSCKFTIKGTADLSLRIKDVQPNSSIVLEPYEKVPFPFTLTWNIEATEDNAIVGAVLAADMNMFIKMVAAKPLENFLKYQIVKLKTMMNG